MSYEVFFISDHHWSHFNLITKFELQDGSPARWNETTGKRFSSVEEHDEHLIKNWNSVVGPNDRVYHGGDFSFKLKDAMRIRPRLNGHINLLVGNHDPIVDFAKSGLFHKIEYWKHFKKLGFIYSHVPIPIQQFHYKMEFNVHGHTHANQMLTETMKVDERYVNVCCERVNNTPLSLDDLLERLKQRKT